MNMKFGITANPAAGKFSLEARRKSLEDVSEILGDCIIVGLDTKSREEFCSCARELSQKVETLVVAGGDGTVSDVINSLDPSVALSYLPYGSGNLLRYTLNLPRNITRVAEQIREGREHKIDLIALQDRKAMIATIGLDGHVLMERERNLQNGLNGFSTYAKATIKSIFGEYERVDTRVNINGELLDYPQTLSLIITKVPYYGYGLKVVPKAKIDDGLLHLLAVTSGKVGFLYGLVTSFLGKNQIGDYKSGRDIKIETERELYLQTDGDLRSKGKSFQFHVLPEEIRMRY